jgi:predicted acyltransferase (DUF342 family)
MKILILLLLTSVSAFASEIEEIKSPKHWSITDPKGREPIDASLQFVNNTLLFNYRKESATALVHNTVLTEFQTLTLTLESERATTLILAVEDRDGATFNYSFDLIAGKRTEVSLKPTDLKLSRNSRTDKSKVLTERLGTGYVLLDAGVLKSESGANKLTVHRAVVLRKELKRVEGDLIIDRDTRIETSTRVEGNIVVTRGSHLLIESPRFLMKGNLWIEDGRVEIKGAVFEMGQRFNHELNLVVKRGSLIFSGTEFRSGYPITLSLEEKAEFSATLTEFQSGLTCDARNSSRIKLSRVTLPGEFIISPDTEISIDRVQGILLWFATHSTQVSNMVFPKGNYIESWKSDSYKIQVEKSSAVNWGIISNPGSKVTVDGDMMAAGLRFNGKSKVLLRNIQSTGKIENYMLPVEDRKLQFQRSTLRAWNLYVEEKAQVTIEGSRFGEIMTSGDATLEIKNSICDGEAGYISAEGRSHLNLKGVKVNSAVIANSHSVITLEDCVVTGDLRATGNSTISLINSKVTGKIEKERQAKVIQK